MIVIDTTVLLYAVGGEHPLRDPARRLFAAVVEGRIAATTTVEVIQEFAHTYARRRSRRLAAEQALRYARLLSPLVVADEASLARGLSLFERLERLDAFDAVLAATALATRAEALVSADAAFAGVRGLRHVAPGSRSFEALLR